MPDRPTKHDVLSKWLPDRLRVYGPMRTQIEIDEDFLLATSTYGNAYGDNSRIRKYLTGFPRDYLFKIPPITKDAVDIGVNNIMVGETPKVDVALPQSSRRSEKKRNDDAQELEDVYQDLLYSLDTYSEEPFLRACVTWGLALGMAAFKYPLAMDRWPTYPLGETGAGVQRKARNAGEREQVAKYQREWSRAQPFAVEAIHPLNLFPDPYHAPAQDYIERLTVRREAFAGQFDLRGAKEGDAECIYYCSPEFYGIWLDQEPLLGAAQKADEDGIAPNPTGICWYRHVWAGFGTRDRKGGFEHMGKGIIRDGRDVIIAYLRARNRLMAVGGLYSFPPIDIEGATKQEAAEEGADFSLTPGAIWPHKVGVHAKILDMGTIPPFIIEEYNQARAELEVHFGPEILRGVQQPGETAEGQASRLTQAKAPYRVLRQNLQQAVGAMLMDIGHMVKYELRQPMNIVGRSTTRKLDPNRIPDDHQVMVNFTPPTDEEKRRLQDEKDKKRQMQVMSTKRYLETDEEVDDPEEEQAQLLADTIMQQPGYMQVLTQAAAQQVQALLGPPPAAPEQPPALAPQGGPENVGPAALQEQTPAPQPQPGQNGTVIPQLIGAPA